MEFETVVYSNWKNIFTGVVKQKIMINYNVIEEEYKRICIEKMERMLTNTNKRNIYIWGAGKGGKYYLMF